ncbi:hypothetical protein [Luteibacter yeojuensis]
MSLSEDNGAHLRASDPLDPDATPHDLLNGAIEWLQYARGLSQLLADLVHESDVVDCRRMALSLEAIAALTNMGVQCTAQAHARMSWDQARDASAFNAVAEGTEAK